MKYFDASKAERWFTNYRPCFNEFQLTKCSVTSKCLKKTRDSVSLKCEGQRMDSMITTLLSRGFTSKCLQTQQTHYNNIMLNRETNTLKLCVHMRPDIQNHDINAVCIPYLKYNVWMNSFRLAYSSSVFILYCTTLMGWRGEKKTNKKKTPINIQFK